jgi:hypothetical protein
MNSSGKNELREPPKFIINLRNTIPAKQNLHLSTVAYNHMISVDNPVEGMKMYDWKKLSNNKRLKCHLQVIAQSLNLELDSFTVLDD